MKCQWNLPHNPSPSPPKPSPNPRIIASRRCPHRRLPRPDPRLTAVRRALTAARSPWPPGPKARLIPAWGNAPGCGPRMPAEGSTPLVSRVPLANMASPQPRPRKSALHDENNPCLFKYLQRAATENKVLIPNSPWRYRRNPFAFRFLRQKVGRGSTVATPNPPPPDPAPPAS